MTLKGYRDRYLVNKTERKLGKPDQMDFNVKRHGMEIIAIKIQ